MSTSHQRNASISPRLTAVPEYNEDHAAGEVPPDRVFRRLGSSGKLPIGLQERCDLVLGQDHRVGIDELRPVDAVERVVADPLPSFRSCEDEAECVQVVADRLR
jgi:hypothetical protein